PPVGLGPCLLPGGRPEQASPPRSRRRMRSAALPADGRDVVLDVQVTLGAEAQREDRRTRGRRAARRARRTRGTTGRAGPRPARRGARLAPAGGGGGVEACHALGAAALSAWRAALRTAASGARVLKATEAAFRAAAWPAVLRA